MGRPTVDCDNCGLGSLHAMGAKGEQIAPPPRQYSTDGSKMLRMSNARKASAKPRKKLYMLTRSIDTSERFLGSLGEH